MKHLILAVLLASTAAHAGFGNLGEAIELDVPYLGEYEAIKGGFPNTKVKTYDPVNKKRYEKVVVGETYKASIFDGYDYWRYVTVYNVKTEAERVAYLPYFEEDCHDASQVMAQWDESRTFKVSLSTSVGLNKLGLNASVTMSVETGVTFSAARRIHATEGIQARHIPYKLSDRWEGVTYIQIYWKDTNELGYLRKLGGFDRFEEYPFPFELDNQNVGFRVKREVLKVCNGYTPENDQTLKSVIYID